eukprot:jgi/Bigna1/88257/estExt_fgenesh1_pg.C_290187
MASVLVTGANGRLGSRIAARLAKEGQKVVATDRLRSPNNEELVGIAAYHHADLSNECDVKALPWEDIDRVVHLAAFPGPSSDLPPSVAKSAVSEPLIGLEKCSQSELLLKNVASAWHVMGSAARNNVKRMIFSSSLFSYGYSHDPKAFVPAYIPLDEEHPKLPHETYGLSKAVGEMSASLLSRSGNGASTEFVSLEFSNIVKAEAFSSLPWELPSPLSSPPSAKTDPGTLLMWAYCHEDDVIEAHVKALSCEIPPHLAEDHRHNGRRSPGNGRGGGHMRLIIAADDIRYNVPTKELLQAHFGDDAANELTKPWKPAGRMAGGKFASIVDNSRAKDVLSGWQPRSWQQQRHDSAIAPIVPPPHTPAANAGASAVVRGEADADNPGPKGKTWVSEVREDGSRDFFVERLFVEQQQRPHNEGKLTCAENAWIRYKIYGEGGGEEEGDNGGDIDSSSRNNKNNNNNNNNSRKKETIVAFTSFDASHSDLEYHVKAGGTLDTDKYRVIVINHMDMDNSGIGWAGGGGKG